MKRKENEWCGVCVWLVACKFSLGASLLLPPLYSPRQPLDPGFLMMMVFLLVWIIVPMQCPSLPKKGGGGRGRQGVGGGVGRDGDGRECPLHPLGAAWLPCMPSYYGMAAT